MPSERTRKPYTIFTRCCITGNVHEYKITAASKAWIRRRYETSGDELVSIKDGWGNLREWLMELTGYDSPIARVPAYHGLACMFPVQREWDWRIEDNYSGTGL